MESMPFMKLVFPREKCCCAFGGLTITLPKLDAKAVACRRALGEMHQD